MPGAFKLDIQETADELKTLLAKQTTSTGRERVHALYLLKTGKVETMTGLADLLGRDISTVFRWFQRYRSKGLEGLLTIPRNQGRKPTIPQEVIDQLRDKLLQSPNQFRSYTEIQTWLKQEYGVNASYKVVHETIRYKLKIKLQTPRSKAMSRAAR